MKNKIVDIIGGGLAGAECAYQLAEAGFKVNLYEMKPTKFSPAHKQPTLAEIVCSNSFKNDDVLSSSGLLKAEMRELGSLVLRVADKCKVPSGNALSVDREQFTKQIDNIIRSHPNITVIEQEITKVPVNADNICVVATGPLTSDALMQNLSALLGEESLYFFDASAPIVLASSLDKTKCFVEDRYGTVGEGDYVNCPMNKAEYTTFVKELVNAKTAELKDFENSQVFEGCMPIEVMAKRGENSLRFGPLKPVGLGNHLAEKPYAIVQLRKENIEEESFNMVGFQTNLLYGEQKRVFSLIPALKNAEIIKYGVMHRNSYINAPKLLNCNYSLRKAPNIYFAGQLSGVEGYIESASSGLVVAKSIIFGYNNNERLCFPCTTMLGAIANYISNPANERNFQPMNSNYGIIKKPDGKFTDKKLLREAIYKNSIAEIDKIKEINKWN